MLPRFLRKSRVFQLALSLGWLAAWLSISDAPALAQGLATLDEPDSTPPPAEADQELALSRRDLAKRLASARRLIAEQRYAEALADLQRVLDNPRDEFFASKDTPEGWTNAKSAAEQLLLSLPAEGQQMYETQNGPTARKMLEDARANSAGLDRLVDRFLQTQAGREGLYLQAARAWELGRPQLAKASLEHLRRLPRAVAELEPMLSLRLAGACVAAGEPEQAIEVLEQLRQTHGREPWIWGGRPVPGPAVGESARWLAALGLPGPLRSADQSGGWLTARGDAHRNGGGLGGAPYLNHGWQYATLADLAPDSREGKLLEISAELTGSDRLEGELAPLISPGAPLIIGDLVVIRTLLDLRGLDRATGRLIWQTIERDRELPDLLRPGGLPQSNQTAGSHAELLVAQRYWQDNTFQALSSDGERVFAVEDLGYMGVTISGRVAPTTPQHNRLAAYDARSGRMLWESGGPRDNSGDPLAGAFFLGTPVAWEGLLYALVEVGSTPQLAILAPETGIVELLQPLAADEPDLTTFDRTRFLAGLSPSIDAGILVCPTGPDLVTAYDPGRRRLLWRHRLRPRQELPGLRHQMLLQQQAARTVGRLPEQTGWLDYGGVVQSGRVLFTPRNSEDLICLNTADGSLAWRSPRGGALYVAGVRDEVVLVVGRNFVQGLNLSDGSPCWPGPITLPPVTGRGCFSEQTYLVPLASAEVATIDLREGRVLSRTRSFAGQVPGSLVLSAGSVISQRFDVVSGFRQFEGLQAEVAQRLMANPRDAEALTIRGQMQLDRGEFTAALADLELAVDLSGENSEARRLLLTALLEGLRTDFPKYQSFGPRAAQLVDRVADRTQLYWLMAQGYERLRNYPAAFDNLLQFGRQELEDRGLERVGASLLIRRDREVVMAADRILAVVGSHEREQLLTQVSTVAREVAMGGDPERTARFLRYFGRLHPEQTAVSVLPAAGFRNSSRWLETEFEIRRSLHRTLGGERARLLTEWGELMSRADHPRDLAVVARWLGSAHGSDQITQDETGAQRATTWLARSDLQRFARDQHDWPAGEITSERLPGVRPVTIGRTQPIAFDGPKGPFLSDVTLELATGDQHVVARDGTGRQLWRLPLEAPVWTGNAQFNRAWIRDHLLLLLIGKDLLAVDLLGSPDSSAPRWLWHQNLIEGSAAIMVQRGLPSPQTRINFAPLGPDYTAVVAAATPDHLPILRGRRLSVLEPLTGQAVWMREGLPSGAGLFGDDEYLLVVPPDSHEAQVFGMRDGSSQGSRRMPPSNWWLATWGSNLLVWGRPLDKPVLALRKVLTDEDLWSREFPLGTLVALVDGEEAVLLDPTGRVTCLSIADGAIRFESHVEPDPLSNELHVLRTPGEYLLIANRPLPPGPSIVRHSQNVHITVNGVVHALEPGTGKLRWSTGMERQQIDPQQPMRMPLLTFASHVFEPRRVGNGLEQRFLLSCVDRRTGKILFEDSRNDEPLHFIDYRIDEESSTIELQLFQSVVRFTFTGKSSTPE